MIESLEQLTALTTVLRRHGWDRAAFAAPDYLKMRFRLGASVAETKVPYGLSSELQTLTETAADRLLASIAMRHREKLGAQEMDRVLLDPSAAHVNLRPEFWYVGDLDQSSIYHTIITRALRRNRLLDAGTLFGWLGKDEIGRTLVRDLQTLVRKLAAEQSRATEEPTLHFGMRALVLHLTDYVPGMARRISAPLIVEACNATAVALYETLFAVLEEHFRESGAPTKPVDEEQALEWHRLILPLSPRAFLRNSTRPGMHAIGPDGLSDELAAVLERYFPRMTERNTPVPEIAKQLTTRIGEDKAGAQLILQEERLERLFAASLTFLSSVRPPDKDAPEHGAYQEIAGIHADPDKLLRIVDDKKAWREWQENWKRRHTAAIAPAMERFSEDIAILPKLTTGFLSDKALLQSVYQKTAKRFIFLRHGEQFDGLLAQQNKVIASVTADAAERREQHAAGRLYLLSAGAEPILASTVSMEEGQLFVDLKDFTKRTFAAKDLKMADFMKWEFYDPILRLSKQYLAGMRHVDHAGIHINNLIGDAVSASGDIVSLLGFARGIKALADEYKGKLKTRLPEEILKKKLAEVDSAWKTAYRDMVAERNGLVGKFNELNRQLKALAPNDAGRQPMLAKLRGLQENVHTVERLMQKGEQSYHERRDAITGLGLEAGLFISFGPAAETVVFQDEIFGNMKVAIGEKINESARGTARDPLVADLLAHHVAKAQQVNKDKNISYPFQVFIDDTIHGPIEPDLAVTLQEAIETRNLDAAKNIVQVFSRRLLNDLVANLERETPDFRMLRLGNGIYNLGIALSEEALEKYLADKSGAHIVRKVIEPAKLHAEIQRAFVFPRSSYEAVLVDSGEEGGPDIFVRLGAILFKGLEERGEIAVYEDLSPQSLFYKLFCKHHVQEWLAAAV